ncbi:MAG: sigma-70 family RNA polymerase sigma factor [Chloroflexi bacterium]|uniref:Sigma-70 family RNA polymerase sigma factor n=1 Tax=Candidatus Chlorohelix allophototropha TaxID=3003348 RepID=A0A8T7M6M6_9CHLR|nr:sigma-70 family RNA polymerase sigma factor [Chloroflexota bacterium]WJW69625.1 sigma-70 family RNA polymerase sigma factor [Chloroflexota bacterium L227-S17]
MVARLQTCEDKIERSDDELARAAASGDSAAFEELVERYTEPLFKVALRFFNDPDEASDILQQVLLKVFIGLPKVNGQLSVRPWLFKIARNVCLDVLKHKRRHPATRFTQLEALVEDWQEQQEGNSPLPDEVIERQETQLLVRKAIAQLPVRYREVVALRSATDLTFGEIGQALGMPENTVKTYFHRAKFLLRKILQDEV